MSLIDEDGNLFGVVNVVDALAIVLLVAVVVAGVAVVSGGEMGVDVVAALAGTLLLVVVVAGVAVVSGDATTAETRYATVELGEQPAYVVDRLEAGDVATLEDGDVATVTDVHVPPTARPDVTIRVELSGVREENGQPTFQIDDTPLVLGCELRLDMGAYAVAGTVTDLDPDDPDLPFAETVAVAEVTLRDVSPAVADELEAGMSETRRGETVATIESIEREPAAVVLETENGDVSLQEHPRNSDVTLALELQTVEIDDRVYFRDDRIGIGSSIDLDFGTVAVDGEVTGIDYSEGVRPDRADVTQAE
ncbi:DUF4330 family protein [Natrialba swarupiae]|uniref:DUF4330 family protein n=1 Tax=Natrialba swarupiae TaxID=2448032 RepID=A0A5D5ALG4_9EURY|nr:DUF4330 family protein [Natrialba swarupiae]TYT60300.1 DUF4330 family protein [Natrialba swarupiae]